MHIVRGQKHIDMGIYNGLCLSLIRATPSLATERLSDQSRIISHHDRLNDRIQPGNTYERPSNDCQDIDRKHERPLFQGLHPTLEEIRVMYPERTGETIRVPGREKRRGDTDEVGKNGDADRQDEGGAVGEHDE